VFRVRGLAGRSFNDVDAVVGTFLRRSSSSANSGRIWKGRRIEFLLLMLGKIMSDLVSVIIPCYGQSRYLGEAIESTLAQAHSRVEVIVVDDGSPDETAEVASRYSAVKLIRQENRGVAAARNVGLEVSRGEYIVFLDADDRLLPQALRMGLKAMATDGDLAFVFGKCQYIDASGQPIPTPMQFQSEGIESYYSFLLECACPIWHTAIVMFRRRALEVAGGFNADFNPAEDYELYLRLARRWPIRYHDGVVAEYRVHHASMSSDPLRMLRAVAKALNSQKGYVEGDSGLRDAWERGLDLCRRYYGGLCVLKIKEDIRKKGFHPSSLHMILDLLRCAPGQFVDFIRG